jgi:hypothetical protein
MPIVLAGDGSGAGAGWGDLAGIYQRAMQARGAGAQVLPGPGDNQNHGGYLAGNRGMVTDQDLFHAGAQRAQQQDRYALAVQAQQLELTQAEQIQLSRLRAAESTIMNDPNLSEDEKDRARLLLRTRIDPMELRQRQQTVQHMELQNQQIMDAQAKAQTMQQMNAQQWAAHVRDHTVEVRPGVLVYVDQQGHPHQLRDESARPQAQRPDPGILTAQQWQQQRRQIEVDQHHVHQRYLTGGQPSPRFRGMEDNEYDNFMRAAIDEAWRSHGLHGTYEDYLARHNRNPQTSAPGQPESGMGGAGTFPRPGEPGGQAGPPAPTRPASTPAAARQDVAGAIDRLDAPEGFRRDMHQLNDRLEEMSRRYSSMSRAERAEFEQLLMRLQHGLSVFRRPNPAPAPPPAPAAPAAPSPLAYPQMGMPAAGG